MDQASRETFKQYLEVSVIVSMVLLTLFSIAWSAVNIFNLHAVNVHGRSMNPTLNNGDIAVVRSLQKVSEGDLIVFGFPDEWVEEGGMESKDGSVVKRVSAVGGSSLTVQDGWINVDYGKKIPIDRGDCSASEGLEVTVPESSVFVTGDNSDHSFDSVTMLCKGFTEEAFVTEEDIAFSGPLVGSLNFGVESWSRRS